MRRQKKKKRKAEQDSKKEWKGGEWEKTGIGKSKTAKKNNIEQWKIEWRKSKKMENEKEKDKEKQNKKIIGHRNEKVK